MWEAGVGQVRVDVSVSVSDLGFLLHMVHLPRYLGFKVPAPIYRRVSSFAVVILPRGCRHNFCLYTTDLKIVLPSYMGGF